MGKIAELIRKFRTARNISQFDLELGINAGLGSISKIEQSKIEPSKETLTKIIEYLKLPAYEAMMLFGLNFKEHDNILAAIENIHAQTNLKNTLQACADGVSKVLNVSGSAIYLVSGDELIFKAISKQWFTSRILNMLGDQTKKIRYRIDPDSQSPQARSASLKQLVVDDSLYTSLKPHVGKALSDLIQSIVGIERIAYLPIVDIDEKLVGLIGIAVSKANHLAEKLPLLYGFLEAAAAGINRFSSEVSAG